MEPVAARREPSHAQVTVQAQTDVAAARRVVAAVVDQTCPQADLHGRAELVATELATNLFRHAEPGGWILVRPLPPCSVEMLAVDRGPGIADVAAALQRRVPEPGGLGCGLAAVRRASARFDISSRPGAGTVVLSVVDLAAKPRFHRADAGSGQAEPGNGHIEPPPRSWAGVSVGISEPCGDGWAVAETGDALSVAVVDGLGHGPKASIAADAALAQFASDPADLDAYLRRANERMRETRGAAVTLCQLDRRAAELRYLSVGNVSGRVVTPAETRGLVNYSGTLGLRLEPPRAKIITAAWPPGASLVLWTDGLSSRVDLAGDHALLAHDPAVVAATLHRDHARNRDDATVVVVRSGVDQR